MLSNVFKTDGHIKREDREKSLNQKGLTLWFTGLSGSGKTTIAHALEKRMYEENLHTFSLDGDNLRSGLNSDLLFSVEDRNENIRRASEISKLINDTGIIVIASFISPFIDGREKARKVIGKNNFIEIYVNTPLEVCEQRDVKGLYKKARSEEIKDFTGIQSPFEAPVSPDLTINTAKVKLDESVQLILDLVLKRLER
jgi:adenylylsulfate kinase